MDHLQFLNQLMDNNLAVNPTRVLLYIQKNPACMQKDMLKPLKISRGLLSQCCMQLINKGYCYQEGSYVSKYHNLTNKGRELLESIKS
jgi:DNA-binding MarR family transcriptional regulator